MDYRMPWRSMTPLSPQWGGNLYDFVGYAVDKIQEAWRWDEPEEAERLTAAITPSQLALWAVLNADGQVCNGGFSQFFYNSYGELAEEALQGFRLLGMPEYAAIFEQAYDAFGTRPIPKDREQRITMLDAMAEDEPDEDDDAAPADPDVPQMLAHYSTIAKGTEEKWDALETEYYALIHRKGVPGGYNAAFFLPLAQYIEAHPQEFFLPKE